MPIRHAIDRRQRLVRTVAWNVLAIDEVLATIPRLRADPDFAPSFAQLSDFREVTEVEGSGDDLRRVAELDPFGPGSRRAAVAPSDVVYGFLRMYMAYTEGHGPEARIFRDLAEAERWLGLSK